MISSSGLLVDLNGAGVVNRLTKDNPNLFYIRDVCHVFNVVVEQALKGFPAYVLQFVRNVFAYFGVGQRNIHLKEIQRRGETEPVLMLSYVQTRWESLLECTNRIKILWKYIKICLDESDSTIKEDINNLRKEFQPKMNFLFYLKRNIQNYQS